MKLFSPNSLATVAREFSIATLESTPLPPPAPLVREFHLSRSCNRINPESRKRFIQAINLGSIVASSPDRIKDWATYSNGINHN